MNSFWRLFWLKLISFFFSIYPVFRSWDILGRRCIYTYFLDSTFQHLTKNKQFKIVKLHLLKQSWIFSKLPQPPSFKFGYPSSIVRSGSISVIIPNPFQMAMTFYGPTEIPQEELSLEFNVSDSVTKRKSQKGGLRMIYNELKWLKTRPDTRLP